MNSFNHYALGAVCGFLYRRVAGIEPIAPGFSRVRVKPVLDRRIHRAGADYDSVRGRFSTNWVLDARRFTLELTIPPGTQAEVHLPTADDGRITESGQPIEHSPEIRALSRGTAETILDIGSGTYVFVISTTPSDVLNG